MASVLLALCTYPQHLITADFCRYEGPSSFEDGTTMVQISKRGDSTRLFSPIVVLCCDLSLVFVGRPRAVDQSTFNYDVFVVGAAGRRLCSTSLFDS